MIQNSITDSPSPLKSASPPGNRLGRTALFVMAGGLFTSSVMLAIVYFIGGSSARAGNQDLLPVAGMALAIGGVCYCWSLFLAIRACRSGESTTLPLWVMNLATLPLASFGIMCWFPCSSEFVPLRRWSISFALPVYLPFMAIACVSGTLLLRPLFRWFEKRRKRLGKPDFTRRQRIGEVVLLCLSYTLLMGVIVLPVPLCILTEIEKVIYNNGAQYSTLGTFAPKYNKVQKQTGSWVSVAYSEYVSDTAERVLSLEPNGEWHYARRPLLRSGNVSFNRLVKLSHDPDEKVAQNALKGILVSHPERIADVASEIISSWKNALRNETFYSAHEIVANYGSFEQRRDLLKDMQKSSSTSPWRILAFFSYAPHDVRLVPILKDMLKSNTMEHQYALEPLIEWLPDDEAEALMEEAWKSNDRLEQMKIREYSFRDDPRDRALGFAVVMNHAPPLVRRQVLFSLSTSPDSHLVEIRFVKTLINLCRDADLTLRRGAVQLLTEKVGSNSKLLGPVRPMYELQHAHRSGFINYLEDPVPASAEELKAIEVIREKAAAWVAEHQKDADK